MFSLKHIIILVICAIIIPLGYYFARRVSLKRLSSALLCVGLVSETVKVFSYIIANEERLGGLLPKTDLPFHLCSIQIIFILIVNLTKSEKIKRMLFSFMMPSCLIGGLAALLIPTSSSLTMPAITVQYFLYHCAIMIFALCLLTSKEFKRTFKDYTACLKLLVGIAFFAIYINSIVSTETVKTNFMYVVGPPESGLPYLTDKYGWLVYIVHYAFLVVTVITLFYLKPIINEIKARKAKKGAPCVEKETENV